MDFDKSKDAAAVHMLKSKQGYILRLPGVMYLDCYTNLALQVCDLYNHVHVEIHLYLLAAHSACSVSVFLSLSFCVIETDESPSPGSLMQTSRSLTSIHYPLMHVARSVTLLCDDMILMFFVFVFVASLILLRFSSI